MVRNFPRITRRRTAAVLALGGVLLTAAVPMASAGGLKGKKHDVAHHIRVAAQDLDESSAAYRKADAALRSAQAELGVARAHLSETRGELAAAQVLDRQMQTRLDAAVVRLASAEQELADGQSKIAAEQRALGEIVVQNYQTGSPGLMGLSMVLTSQDPTQLTGQLNSVQNVIDKESVTLDHLEAARVLLTVHKKQVAAAKADVASQRKTAAANLVHRKDLEAQAATATTQVAALVSSRAQAQQAAAKAKAADLAELDVLQQEKTRISTMLQRRAAAARRNAGGGGGSLASNGYLSWPVAGPVTSPFGWRIHPIFGYRSLHDGIDIAAACRTPIHAPAPGKVLEEYFQTAWGNRIILDLGYHGGVGLATIINHMSGYAVRAGQTVKRGQVIGYIGTTGWSTGCHTHFTVMANGVAVDPMNWL